MDVRPLRTFSLATLADAEVALDFFNGFHDAFVKRVTVVSFDAFDDAGDQQCSGRLDLILRFAHWNYDFADGLPRPRAQEVEAEFRHVRDLSFQFSGRETEWTVKRLVVSAGMRAKMYPPSEHEPCLRAVLVQPRLRDWGEWLEHDDAVFTFLDATIRELPLRE